MYRVTEHSDAWADAMASASTSAICLSLAIVPEQVRP
jgi:hypothetical protein